MNNGFVISYDSFELGLNDGNEWLFAGDVLELSIGNLSFTRIVIFENDAFLLVAECEINDSHHARLKRLNDVIAECDSWKRIGTIHDKEVVK